MSKIEQINVAVNPEATQLNSDELGISNFEAIVMYVRRVVHHRGAFWNIRKPNAETIAAIEASERGEGERITLEEMRARFKELES
ncbi:MAG: hypothetical protein HAW65_05815 [Alphaproteobacteria bacterium]|nr:hypothetical protein [Alphaproteobacteria bacterium]MBE8220805.1 hypothetical protein [Alphaproteobacteria bacterium]